MLDEDREGSGSAADPVEASVDAETPENTVDVPEVDVPEVDGPSVPDPADGLADPSSVDSTVSGPFVTAVVYANVALFGVSLGAMLLGFRGQWRWGGAAVLVGLFAAVRTYQTYRSFEAGRADRDAGESEAPDSAEEAADADDARAAEVD
ncbi:DUF7322 domain-containing protein [Candidatus Halobonum tyrrellensis]|uniref:DUF7322 domain-containing protein n=1 Tax=Candidatus Halobonum tyrrellensis G22 TaxID=1324957 RepID=V4GTH0_9EURY|nr:hypothetical protein [Candidatus Halobonum tyrrellensis]ESP88391.1 hypothetical protein K933_09717 [Candidatus Halobonum tyrrellensis G22]